MKIFLKCIALVGVATFFMYLISSVLYKIHIETLELDSIAFQEQYTATIKAFNLIQPYLDIEQKNALEQRILQIESAGIPAHEEWCSDSFASVLQDIVLENCSWAKRKVEPLDISCEDESEGIEKILAPIPREKVWQLSWQLHNLHSAIDQKTESWQDLATKETRIDKAISAIEELFAKKDSIQLR